MQNATHSDFCSSARADQTRPPIKLLIYSHFFAPSVGGVEAITLSLAMGLAAGRGGTKFAITVVTQTPAAGQDDAEFPFQIVREPSIYELFRLIRQADVVHLAGPALMPLLWSWLGGKPRVIEHHGYQSICPNGILMQQPERSVCPGHFVAGNYGNCLNCLKTEMSGTQAWRTMLQMFPRHWLSRGVTANIEITEYVKEREKLPNSVVVYHGIEDPYLGEATPSASLATPEAMTFAFVGRFVPEKGIFVLLEAAKVLKKQNVKFELRLIGDGPERSKIEQKITDNDLESSVKITGYLAGTELAKVLADVHVVVMPSIWEETAGLAAMEQMMKGRLVIASDIGGLGEIIAEAGLLFPAGNAEALAACMAKVLADRSLMRVLGEKARARSIQLFGRERMIEEHASVYRRIMTT